MNEVPQSDKPFIKFVNMFKEAKNPVRADKALYGNAPLRAYRYCEPFTAASSFGWYAFPPIDFSLRWDGTHIFWKQGFREEEEWVLINSPVLPKSAKLLIDRAASHGVGANIPFLACPNEIGIIQIWTGLLASTPQGWSISIRSPVNIPRDPFYEVLSGIIETDWWFGPMVTPIRITKTDVPITFQRNRPLFQIQPVPRIAYLDETLKSYTTSDVEEMSEEDWERFYATLERTKSVGGRAGDVPFYME